MAKRGTISELFELPQLKEQQAQAVKLVTEFVDEVKKAQEVRINLKGSDKTKDILKGTTELGLAVQEYKKIQDGLAVSQAKLIALESEHAKKLVESKLAIQDQNQATKEEIRLNQAAEGSIKQKQIQLKQLQRDYDALGAAQRDNVEGRALLKSIQELDKELKTLEGSTGRFQRNVGNYSSATKILEKSLGDVNKKLDDNAKSNKLSASAVELLTKEQQLLESFLNRQQAAFSSVSGEIKENTLQLQKMAQAGLDGSEAYKLLFAETSRLKDETADLKTALKNAAPDDVAFEGAAQAARGLVGVYGLAKSTAAAFGIENEALEETLVKLQAAETALHSIEAIRVALKKESALRQAINIGLQKVETIQTNLMTAAESKNIVVRYAAIAAQKALNFAMSAAGGPITAVIGVIALLLVSMAAFGSSADRVTEKLKRMNEQLELQAGTVERSIQALQDANKKYLAELEVQGKSEQQIRDASIRSLEEQRQVAKQYYDDADRNLQRYNTRLIRSGKVDAEYAENYAKAKEIAEKAAEDFFQIEQQLEIARLNNQRDTNKEIEDFDKQIQEKRKQDSEKARQEAIENAKRQRAAIFEILKLQIQDEIKLQTETSGNSETPASIRLQALQKEINLKQILLTAEREFELSNSKLTGKERELVTARYLSNLLQLEKEHNTKTAEILRQSGEDQKAAELERQQKRLEGLTEGLNNQLGESEKLENNRLTRLNQLYQSGAIDFETFEKRKAKIELDGLKDRLDYEIKFYESLVQLSGVDEKTKADALRKLAALRKQFTDIGNKEEKESADTAAGLLERKKELYKELASEAVDTFQTILTAGFEREKNAIQESIDMLEKKKQIEIEGINASALSAEEKAARIQIVEARAQAEREKLEQRQRQVEQQRARVEKAFNIAKIIADTAVAIIGQLKVTPLPAGLPFIAAIGAIGAAQLARVIATPIPKYGEGTEDHPGGLAILGDKNKKELVKEPSGKTYWSADKPTLYDLPRHTVVIPDSDSVVKSMIYGSIMNMGSTRAKDESINKKLIDQYEKQTNRVIETIKNKREIHIKPGFNSVMAMHKYGNRWVGYINENTNF
jgi:hypothetical protein